MGMRVRAACLAVLGAALCGPAGAATNLLVNGDFENPAAPTSGPSTGALPFGWDGYNDPINAPWSATGLELGEGVGGSWAYINDAVGSNGVNLISQSLVTTPGAYYRISFSLALWTGALNAQHYFTAAFGNAGSLSVTKNSFAAPPTCSQGYCRYEHQTFSFIARAQTPMTTVAFAGIHTDRPSSWKLDNASVTATSVVPEPSTWMMMILGFGMVAQALRRRHRAFAA
jgi:hypothetical protein